MVSMISAVFEDEPSEYEENSLSLARSELMLLSLIMIRQIEDDDDGKRSDLSKRGPFLEKWSDRKKMTLIYTRLTECPRQKTSIILPKKRSERQEGFILPKRMESLSPSPFVLSVTLCLLTLGNRS